MGDIVNSRGLEPEVRERVTQAAKNIFDKINMKYRSSLLAGFGLVRGDSFEGVLSAQHNAPQIIQDIIKVFYRVDKTLVRICAVMGELTITSSDRNEVDGPAFITIMEELTKLKERESDHWMQISFEIGTLEQPLIRSQLDMLSVLTERWTEKQREICWTAEEIEAQEAYPKDIEKKQELYRLITNRINVVPSVVKKQLAAASYDVYRRAWSGITEYLANIDEYALGVNITPQKSYLTFLNLGQRKIKQHHHQDAIPLLEKSLEMAKQGEINNQQLILIYITLAEAYSETSMYKKADAAIQSAQTLQLSMPKSQWSLDLLVEQARAYYKKMNYHDAKTTLENALSVAGDILNPSAPDWGTLYSNLALLHDESQDYTSALAYYEKALGANAYIEHSEINHAITLHNMAGCLHKLNDYDRAVNTIEKALQIFNANLPQNHKYIIDARALMNILKEHQKGESP